MDDVAAVQEGHAAGDFVRGAADGGHVRRAALLGHAALAVMHSERAALQRILRITCNHYCATNCYAMRCCGSQCTHFGRSRALVVIQERVQESAASSAGGLAELGPLRLAPPPQSPRALRVCRPTRAHWLASWAKASPAPRPWRQSHMCFCQTHLEAGLVAKLQQQPRLRFIGPEFCEARRLPFRVLRRVRQRRVRHRPAAQKYRRPYSASKK